MDQDVSGGELFDWETPEAEPAESSSEESDQDEGSEGTRKPAAAERPASRSSDDDDSDDEEPEESAAKTQSKPAAKPKQPRKRTYKRGGKDIEVDLDDEDALAALIADMPKHRVKVDGEELEITLEDALKDYELRSASNARMRSASEAMKKHQAEVEKLKGDKPALLDFLRDTMDVDPLEVLLHAHEEEIMLQSLIEQNPQEFARRTAELERKKAQREVRKQQEREQAQREAQEQQARTKKFFDELNSEIDSQGLKRNQIVYGLLRQMTRNAASDKVSPREIVYEAKRMIRESIGGMLPEDASELASMLGDKRVKALAQLRVEKAKPKDGGKPQAKPKREREDTRSALERWMNG